jgi:hypothetical protein
MITLILTWQMLSLQTQTFAEQPPATGLLESKKVLF